ncbi:MAG TPA: flagellar basal body rod protein FlgB [Phycisphaerales bacterium]|nr:flagellar basal body rod protein FlgB [Phycisphaerales bacterium]HCD34690.1 flagellar basal body rod protein FlgB [Phycisphaerales bacterium]|tara:strand:+ start:671 stop:1114 length:444 start_codon:yes stop_codon:yes gene_type:complete
MATFIKGMLDGGALPVLERYTQFTAERHKVLTHNIANFSTPFFKPRDLSIGDFQATLADAVDKRRKQVNPTGGPLRVGNTQQVTFGKDGMTTYAEQTNENILFHDQNNRDLERTMQKLAENTLSHNMGIELLKNQFDLLRTAIRERM